MLFLGQRIYRLVLELLEEVELEELVRVALARSLKIDC